MTPISSGRTSGPRALAAAVLLISTGSASAQPVITGVEPSTTTPSGLITIVGSGFGTDPSVGSVEVNGVDAIVTTWRDNKLRGYVPEATPTGPAGVRVTTPAGTSNELSITVEPRQPDGRVRWRFEFDANFPALYLAVAPNGTVYVVNYTGYPADLADYLFAISPNGALLWTAPMPFGVRTLPISLLDDGGIVTGNGEEVRVFNPDGSVRWTFTYDSGGFDEVIEVGPQVGPDGNIYGATSVAGGFGLGAFSLTPQGELRWSIDGDPSLIQINSTVYTRPVFTDFTFYFPWEISASALPQVYGFELDGTQITYFNQASYPRADFLGRVLYFNGGLFGDLTAIDAISGEPSWAVEAHFYPVVDAQSNVYSSLQDIDWHVVSYAPDGSPRWVSEAAHVWRMLAVSPDDTSVLYAGSDYANPPDWVSSLSADDGTVEWTVPMRPKIGYGGEEYVRSKEAVYAPNGATVYFNTWSYDDAYVPALWAVAVSEEPAPGDLDGDGVVGALDFLAMLAAWGPCDAPCPPACAADLDEDCTVGINDFLILLANWS